MFYYCYRVDFHQEILHSVSSHENKKKSQVHFIIKIIFDRK